MPLDICGGMSTNNNSGGSNSSGFVPGNFITYTFTTGAGGWVAWPPAVPAADSEKKNNKDGCDCKKCKEFYPYAEPNQDDGTLICYQCRIGW